MSYLLDGGVLTACDGCGAVVLLSLAQGWATWSAPTGGTRPGLDSKRHHCPTCVEHNRLLAAGLIRDRDRADAIVYDLTPEKSATF